MRLKLLLIILAFTLVANAQKITETLGNNYVAAYSIPKAFSYNDIPKLLMYQNVDGGGIDFNAINIYDENIDLIKSIKLKNLHYDYQLSYHIEEREIQNVQKASTNIRQEYASYQDFIDREKILNPNFTEDMLIFEKLDNGDRKITYDYTKCKIEPQYMYYHYETFGTKYPTSYMIEHEGKVTAYSISYNIIYSDWEDKGIQVQNFTKELEPLELCNLNLNNDAIDGSKYFQISQTLFNNDEGYEYIVPKIRLAEQGNWNKNYYQSSTTDDSYAIITARSTLISKESEFELIGFQIVSENGSVIQDYDFEPFKGNISTYRPFVITIGNNTYLAFDGTNSDKQNVTLFYKIDRATTSLKKVQDVRALMKVFPTCTEKGSIINIDLGKENKNDSEISIYSTSGTKIKSFKIAASQQKAKFSITEPTGMYIIHKTTNNEPSESQKIIIK